MVTVYLSDYRRLGNSADGSISCPMKHHTSLPVSAPKMKSAMAADAVNNVESQSELVSMEEKADESSDGETLPEAPADLINSLLVIASPSNVPISIPFV